MKAADETIVVQEYLQQAQTRESRPADARVFQLCAYPAR